MRTYCQFHPERYSVAGHLCDTCYKREKRHSDPEYKKKRTLLKRQWEARHPKNVKARQQRYRVKHRKELTEKKRQSRHWTRYGIKLSIVQELDKQQDFRCKICNVECKLVTDHNHATGKFRGRICRFCNTGLGTFMDNPLLLQKAIEYLRAPFIHENR